MKMSEIKAWYAALNKPPKITPELWAEIKPLVKLILRQRPIPDWKLKEMSDALDDLDRRCRQRGSKL